MKIQTLPPDEVVTHLVTSDQGLSEDAVQRRLHEYGLNEIRQVRGKPLALRFLSQFTHFLALLLWAAAALSFLSEYLHPREGMLTLGVAIIMVIFINAAFTFIQEYRAERAVEALRALLRFDVTVLREGAIKEIPVREIVPGDLIMLKEGDRISADARLIETNRMMVNNAPLTGESESKPREHTPFEGEYLDSPNIVFAGTLVVSGSGKAVVFATGMATEFGKIAHLTGGIEEELSPLQKEITLAARVVAAVAVIVGLSFFNVGLLFGRSIWSDIIFAIGIIVALVPEGLLPTVTLSLAIGSQRMARKKALIKSLTSVETLGAVTVICSDKTGTLTQNKIEVKELWTAQGHQASLAMLLMIASLCNNARFDEGVAKGDPTETALLKAAHERKGDIHAARINEIPFDSERKRMTTVHALNNETYVLTKGALETVLPLCTSMMWGDDIVAITEDERTALINIYHAMMDKGLRVMAFAFKKADGATRGNETLLEKDLVFVGLAGLEDPPRPEVYAAIEKCRSAGIKVIMLTGDASRTALAVAREIGLVRGTASPSKEHGRPVIIEGTEMDTMPDSRLREVLAADEIIFARMTPNHKIRIVSILKEEGERVAVTGDGVNDAPALKKADIGIAMGIAGTDVAKESADMILLDDNFATIVNAVEEGRAVLENIKKFITYVFVSNVAEMVPFIAFILFNVPLPLTILQVLAIDLGTDMFPALALGAETPSKEAMTRPPRGPEERLINSSMLLRIFFFLGAFEAAGGLFGFFYVLSSGGWQWGDMLAPQSILYMQATTACFGGIVIMQIANVFACRSFRESVFSMGLFSNRLILLGIAIEIAISFFIIYTPMGNRIFGTAPLGADVWLILVPFGIMLFFAEEARKWMVRKHSIT